MIGPSNPLASIAPILAVPGIREALLAAPAPVLAVSPIVGGEVLKGPTAAFMAFAALECSADGVADFYGELLDGMLGNDLLGFHTQGDCNNFLECVDRALECRIDRERFAVQRAGRDTTVRPFPISVDPALADEYLDGWGARAAAVRKRHRLGDRPLIVGVDRVDYTKDWQGFWSGLQNSVFGAFLSPMFPYGNAEEEHGVATLKMTNPDNFSTGIKLRPFDDWQFNFDLKWSGYSDWNNLEIEFDRELDLLRIAKNFAPNGATDHSIILDRGYRDTWSYAMGVQYDVNDRLQLRAGYEYRPSAIPKSKADALVPIGDADLYGLGLGYRWDKDTNIDLGFNYFVSKQSIKAGQSCNLTCTGIDNLVYNPYAGMDVHTTVKAYIFALTYNTTF